MKVTIEKSDQTQEPELVVRCCEITDSILKIVEYANAVQVSLVGYADGKMHRLSLNDIYYFEVVENKAFLYCEKQIYECKMRLYEFEELSKNSAFFRASKSMILNADIIEYISPSFSGRFEAVLRNGEKVLVSRQYVGALKKSIGL